MVPFHMFTYSHLLILYLDFRPNLMTHWISASSWTTIWPIRCAATPRGLWAWALCPCKPLTWQWWRWGAAWNSSASLGCRLDRGSTTGTSMPPNCFLSMLWDVEYCTHAHVMTCFRWLQNISLVWLISYFVFRVWRVLSRRTADGSLCLACRPLRSWAAPSLSTRGTCRQMGGWLSIGFPGWWVREM